MVPADTADTNHIPSMESRRNVVRSIVSYFVGMATATSRSIAMIMMWKLEERRKKINRKSNSCSASPEMKL